MSYKHLTLKKRERIRSLLHCSQKFIARKVGVSPSTVCRELQNNRIDGQYIPLIAHLKAEFRKRFSKKYSKFSQAQMLKIFEMIKKDWSPEQISGVLKLKKSFSVCAQTIYRLVEKNKKNGGFLFKHLRRAPVKHGRKPCIKAKYEHIPNKKSIGKRPFIVSKRTRFGDWEADTILGTDDGGFLVTLTERFSRFTLIDWVRHKCPVEVMEATVRNLKPYMNFVKTITVDNGVEFAWHKIIAHKLDTKVYFADPFCSWQRGSNENVNGLIRQYFPKDCSFTNVLAGKIKDTMQRINDRPKKCLGYRTPLEIFSQNTSMIGEILNCI